MTRKKTRAMTVVSVLDDRQRLAAFVVLLLTVDKQTAPNRNRSKKYKIESEDQLARPTSGPCFYWRLVYHVLIDYDFSKRDNHDRYYRFNIDQYLVPDNAT